jgi:hypothetical protein
MRRFAVLLALLFSGTTLLPAPASATCDSMRFDRAIHKADAVWWGTVTGVTMRGSRDRGNGWTLTVHISDLLKGREHVGDSAKYLDGFCGYSLTRNQGKEYARQFIGEQMLFVGTYMHGRLQPRSDLFREGLWPAEQYQRALKELGLHRGLKDLGLDRGVHDNAPTPSSQPFLVRWFIAALVVIAVAVFVFGRRRRVARRL